MAKLPNHLFVSSIDGGLWDTRVDGWHTASPLRPNYHRHHAEIRSVTDLKATLRVGEYTWPGGYPLYFVASDGEALSFDSVRENLREVMQAMADKHDRSGWRVVACQINYEDTDLCCAHSGEFIECAYAGHSAES